MLIRIDTGSADPLYGQIAAQFRHAIAHGEIAPGDRLPAAKELAAATGVNLHTVLRAYAELRDAGLIELRPRRGAVVRPSGPVRARLTEQVRQLVESARLQGLTKSEILELVRSEL
jgi:DNA-binding transcriptional regulator YhcF (GntR family)